MSNIPAGSWKYVAGYTWPGDLRPKRWRVKPRRGRHFGKPLLWCVFLNGHLHATVLDLDKAMVFIERYERGII